MDLSHVLSYVSEPQLLGQNLSKTPLQTWWDLNDIAQQDREKSSFLIILKCFTRDYILPTIHQSASVKLSLWSKFIIILFLLKFTSCVDRTVRQKHKLALLHFIYLDFWMVVALTSSTVHDIEFKGFQLATWLALLLCFIHERWIWIWLFHGQIPKRY